MFLQLQDCWRWWVSKPSLGSWPWEWLGLFTAEPCLVWTPCRPHRAELAPTADGSPTTVLPPSFVPPFRAAPSNSFPTRMAVWGQNAGVPDLAVWAPPTTSGGSTPCWRMPGSGIVATLSLGPTKVARARGKVWNEAIEATPDNGDGGCGLDDLRRVATVGPRGFRVTSSPSFILTAPSVWGVTSVHNSESANSNQKKWWLESCYNNEEERDAPHKVTLCVFCTLCSIFK